MRLGSGANSALGLLAYISGIALAVLAAAQADLAVVITVALVFVALASALFVPGAWNWWREGHPRAQMRRKEALRRVTGLETDQHPSDLPDGVYGYEEIFAMHGLRGRDARLKPNPAAPDGHAYPIEVHKLANQTYLVGWVSASDKQFLAGTAECHLTLWMRRQRRTLAGFLVEVPLSRVVADGESRGEGSRTSGFRLMLEIGETT